MPNKALGISMRAASELFEELKALGAGEFAHLNGSLDQHLRGTELLLRRWGCSESTCVAGLFHAAYGTAGYGEELVSLNLRGQVANLIGSEAEELVYLYCACDRKVFYPRIGTPSQRLLPDRFTGKERELTELEFRALCAITVANESEIAAGSAEFREKYGQALAKLFARMQGFVSEVGLSEARRVLGNE